MIRRKGETMSLCDRRSVLTGLGAVGANLWLAPCADALGLADDKIKVIRYFSNAGDTAGSHLERVRPGVALAPQFVSQ